MIDKKMVEHIAMLSRISLSEDEVERFGKEFEDILAYFKKIEQLNVENASSFSLGTNALREDVVEVFEHTEDIRKNFCSRKDDYLKAPKTRLK